MQALTFSDDDAEGEGGTGNDSWHHAKPQMSFDGSFSPTHGDHAFSGHDDHGGIGGLPPGSVVLTRRQSSTSGSSNGGLGFNDVGHPGHGLHESPAEDADPWVNPLHGEASDAAPWPGANSPHNTLAPTEADPWVSL